MTNHECDFSDPKSVVSSFIRAMHQWEIEAEKASLSARKSADPFSYQETVLKRMNDVFQAFCTPKERKFGRLGSFQSPPEYDPENESILDIKTEGRRSEVDTERRAILGGGHFRYVLTYTGGKWLIDSLKFKDQGGWKPAIL